MRKILIFLFFLNLLMGENLEGKMKKEHPRLFISENDIERIKNLIEKNEEAKRIYEKIKERAEKICNEEVTKYEIPDGLRLLGTSSKVLDRVYILSFAFLIEKDEKYLKRDWEN
jgi:deoxyhypusine synthase